MAEIAATANFAWQGWLLETPPDWGLVEERGAAGSGSVVLADDTRVRLEFSWQPSPVKVSAKKLGKFFPKVRGAIAVEQHVEWLPQNERIPEHRLVRTPPGSPDLLEAVIATGPARRTGLARFFLSSDAGAAERPEVRTTLGSIQALEPESAWPVRLFDVDFAVPGSWPLRYRSLGVGLKRFVYACPAGRLHINALNLARRRPGPANAWVSAFLQNAYPGIRAEVREGETGIRIRGRTHPWVIRPRNLHAGLLHRYWNGRLVRRPEQNMDYVILFAHRAGVGHLAWEDVIFPAHTERRRTRA